MRIKYDNHEMLVPFGAYIYKTELLSSELLIIQELAEKCRTAEDASDGLVGNMKEQRQFILIKDGVGYQTNSTQVWHEQYEEILDPHIRNYISYDEARKALLSENDTRPRPHGYHGVNFMEYNLGNGPWFNYMKQYDFNPLHAHYGGVSGIVMVRVPKEIANENMNPETPNFRSGGMLEWISSDNASAYKVIPKEGDLYLFPSYLKHTVYPFRSDVERISSSFNVFDIEYVKPIEVDYE